MFALVVVWFLVGMLSAVFGAELKIGGTGVSPVVSGVPPETVVRAGQFPLTNDGQKSNSRNEIRRDAEFDRRDARATRADSARKIKVQIVPKFEGRPLAFEKLSLTNSAGQIFSVTRLDFLLSDFALRRSDGNWFEQTNWQAFLSLNQNRSSFTVEKIPAGNYDKIRFHVGLRPEINHSKPEQYPADHPLNPVLNGLHWGWAGGYVFFAIEGNWRTDAGKVSGYSFHLGIDPMLMTVGIPVELKLNLDQSLQFALNLDGIFDFKLSDENSSTHSRTGDELAESLRKNVERAFSSRGNEVSRPSANRAQIPDALVNRKLQIVNHPYRFTFSAQFPVPDLPRDNPLTEEGVELGHRLFSEKLLSVNGKQSCASCHREENAFSDPGKKFSPGAEGKEGTRNAMPVFNLAWKKSFFWDGRAATLREQVLMPIQNPIEMHETLENAVAKLAKGGTGVSPVVSGVPPETVVRVRHFPLTNDERKSKSHDEIRRDAEFDGRDARATHNQIGAAADYPALFERAFGSREITAGKIARALEQFVLSQVSFDSKFDRAMDGKAELTDEEKRGFQLFVTEYDPRRGQFGADCFHCHGGPLFQSQTFANNGLDSNFKDLGRYEATKKDGDKGKFSVPSLRNVAVTGPYMHDGRFKTLEEVVGHYSDGVKRSDTLDPNLAKHPDAGIRLSDEGKKALVAFLKALTDEKFLNARVAQANTK